MKEEFFKNRYRFNPIKSIKIYVLTKNKKKLCREQKAMSLMDRYGS